MEKEIIVFLTENKQEIINDIKQIIDTDHDFKDEVISFLKNFILSNFALNIEEVSVILSNIEHYSHDLNFFLDLNNYNERLN